MKAIHNIDPIYDENSLVLILGSMPSVTSRDVQFFYAHKQNRFWKIFEALFNVTLNTIEEKKKFLIQNHIALWDVISSCDIKGSDDASIKNVKINDIDTLIQNSSIQCIFCTGKKAYTLLCKNFKTTLPIICLPSPSGANAKCNLDDLITAYKQICSFLK